MTSVLHWGNSQEPGHGKPTLLHVPGPDESFTPSECTTLYRYPEAASAGFVVPGHPDFKMASASVAHTRSLAFFKRHLGGPFFDLEKIWDEHTLYEFGERSVDKTMATMVDEPYVNHVPTVCHLT